MSGVRGPRVLVWGALALVLVQNGLVGSPARAATDTGAEYRAAWAATELLIEEYHTRSDARDGNRATHARLTSALAPLRREVVLAQARLGDVAAEIYKYGVLNNVNVMLGDATTGDVAFQLAFFDHTARARRAQIEQVAHLVARLDARTAPLTVLADRIAAQEAGLAALKRSIDHKLNDLRRLRIRSYGTATVTGMPAPSPCPVSGQSRAGPRAAAFACEQIGQPYRFGGVGPAGYDSSGLVAAAWSQADVRLPHGSVVQRRVVPAVSRSDLRVGDIVFYYATVQHVAIFVGDNMVVHTSGFGDRIRLAAIDDVGPVHSYGRPVQPF